MFVHEETIDILDGKGVPRSDNTWAHKNALENYKPYYWNRLVPRHSQGGSWGNYTAGYFYSRPGRLENTGGGIRNPPDAHRIWINPYLDGNYFGQGNYSGGWNNLVGRSDLIEKVKVNEPGPSSPEEGGTIENGVTHYLEPGTEFVFTVPINSFYDHYNGSVSKAGDIETDAVSYTHLRAHET